MRVSLLSENLQKKINFVNHAISTKSQLPILLNIFMEAKDGKFSISTTDLEIGIIIEVPAKIEEEGAITVPAKTFTELVSTIPAGKISLETTPEGLSLVGEKTKTFFQTTPAEEFPKLYEEKGKEVMVLKKDSVENDFSKVAFAASIDSERPALSGVLVREEGDGFLMVATDGYRLSLKRQALNSIKKEKGEGDISMLVPARVIRELVQAGKDIMHEDVGVFISKEKNQIIFSQGETTLIGRLIEAEFPNYEKIIPTDFSTKTIFERQDLQKAIKASYVFARQTAGIVKLSIGKNKITVSANAPSVGSNTVEIDAKTDGEENDIAFNARYLLDCLANSTSETMSFEMTGPLNPGVFKEADDPSFMHLIMPIRVQQESE
ncbi:MAG: DNA polymerase III subunit beta [Candidatus Levybacteria bacterium]|nr:DNA polymerase III subunit beta [Candidatus Levybacteria bacterium]